MHTFLNHDSTKRACHKKQRSKQITRLKSTQESLFYTRKSAVNRSLIEMAAQKRLEQWQYQKAC